MGGEMLSTDGSHLHWPMLIPGDQGSAGNSPTEPSPHTVSEAQVIAGSLAEALGVQPLKVSWTLGLASKITHSHDALA